MNEPTNEKPLPTPITMLEKLKLREADAISRLNEAIPGIEVHLDFVAGRAKDAISCIMYLFKKIDELEKQIGELK